MLEDVTKPPNFIKSGNVVISEFLVDMLLSPSQNIRQCAAVLTFNISLYKTSFRPARMPQDEEWTSGLVAALCNAIEKEIMVSESQEETLFKLLASVGLLLYSSNESVIELANAVGLEDLLKAARFSGSNRLKDVRRECALMLSS